MISGCMDKAEIERIARRHVREFMLHSVLKSVTRHTNIPEQFFYANAQVCLRMAEFEMRMDCLDEEMEDYEMKIEALRRDLISLASAKLYHLLLKTGKSDIDTLKGLVLCHADSHILQGDSTVESHLKSSISSISIADAKVVIEEALDAHGDRAEKLIFLELINHPDPEIVGIITAHLI